jgi:hypothetical protein
MSGKDKQQENNEEFAEGYAEARSGNVIKDVAIGFHDNSSQFEKGYEQGKEDRSEHGWKSYDECGTGETKDSGCFLTTACVQAAGLPDNCRELTVLRHFRDNFVKALTDGDTLIQEYYDQSPRIVEKLTVIELREIYATIQDAVSQIDRGELSEAFKTYAEMFKGLRNRYFI